MRAQGAVLLVGPDGAGKSTVAAEVRRMSSDVGVEVRTAHLRPGLLGRRPPAATVTAPHAAAPRGLIASLAKLAVGWIDTVMGWLGPWGSARRSGVLLIERGWFDQAVDPARYRLPAGLSGFVTTLGRALPRADVGVLLMGDPAEVVARKPELRVDEVERQISRWREVLPLAARRASEIDTTTSDPASVATRILELLDETPLVLRRTPATPHRLRLVSSPGRAGRVAARIYRPQKARAGFAAAVGTFLTPLGRPADGAAVAAAQLAVDAVRAAADASPAGVAAMRSSATDRWVVGCADHARLRFVAKVGPSDDEALVNEEQVLARLEGSAVRVPRLVTASTNGGRRFLVTEAEEVEDPAPLSPEEVARLCHRIASAGVCHGDLAPWNVLRSGHELIVIDWEHSLPEPDALADFAHYICQEGALLGRWAPREAASLIRSYATESASHDTELPGSPLDRLRPTSDPRCRTFRSEVARCLAG